MIADHVRCLTFALTDGAVPEQRGPRLRAAPHPAPRGALRAAAARAARAVPAQARAGRRRRDGRRVPGAEEEPAARRRDHQGRGGQLRPDARSRHRAVRRSRASAPRRRSIAAKTRSSCTTPTASRSTSRSIMADERGMTVDIDGLRAADGGGPRARPRRRQGGRRRGCSSCRRTRWRSCSRCGVKPTDDSAKFNAAPIGATVQGDLGRASADRHDPRRRGGRAGRRGHPRQDQLLRRDGRPGRRHRRAAHRRRRGDGRRRRRAPPAGTCCTSGNMVEGHLSVGDHVTATLAGVRPRTEKNHTATHLANWALREVLGDGVQQKGSLVDPDKLRFDFSHGKALSDDEIGRVETLVSRVHRAEAAGLRRGCAAGAGAEDQRPARRLRREVSADGARRVDRRAGGGPAEGPGEREVAAVLHRVLRRHAPEEHRRRRAGSSSPARSRSARASAESSP